MKTNLTDQTKIESFTLPAIYEEFADVIGIDATLLIAKTKGGNRTYFSKNAAPLDWLIDLIGQEKATLLCNHIVIGKRDIALYLPFDPEFLSNRQKQNALIDELIKEGMHTDLIAVLTNVSNRTVYRRKALLKEQSTQKGGENFDQ